MIYLLGGSARSGKTTIAKRFLNEMKVSYFSLDYLMMGIANGVPELKVNPISNAFLIGRQLWHIIDPMITAMVENGTTCLFEGNQLVPRYVKQLEERYGKEIRSCFLGFAESNPNDKLSEILNYKGTENNWVENCSYEELAVESEKLIDFSKGVREECKKYGLTYFDVSSHYDEIVGEVVEYLKKA
ncbi:MAG: adenylate kinase [Bacillota bacterium]